MFTCTFPSATWPNVMTSAPGSTSVTTPAVAALLSAGALALRVLTAPDRDDGAPDP
jgi:hypothetical protein